MKKYVLCVVLTICLLSLAACKQEVPVETTLSQTTEAAAQATAATEAASRDQLTHLADGKITVGFQSTKRGWQYAAIEDQEAAVAAFEKAISSVYSDEWWIKGDRTLGIQVEYEGEIWQFMESGELVYPLGRVKAEDAADLYALCVETAREAGWQDAIKPEQFQNIVSATLRVKAEEYPLTDAAALEKLEAMLSSGKYELGGTGCPFTALLDMTLESGETLTVALATDSCGVWMSEGYYYSYGSDSQPLYDLFGVTMDMVAPYNNG